MVRYGEEGLFYAVNSFTVSDTTFLSSGVNAIGIQEPTTCPVPVQLSNTSFAGVNTQVDPAGCSTVPATSVSEPQSFWLLLTALCCCAGFFTRAAPQLIPQPPAVSEAVPIFVT